MHPIWSYLLICLAVVRAENGVAASLNSPMLGHETNFNRLDDGVITVVFDLSRGGAIAGIAKSGSSRNLVNVADEGRYIQQSYYAGRPLDRKAEGQSPKWSPWSWNPIQVGDAFGHRASILLTTNDRRTFYINRPQNDQGRAPGNTDRFKSLDLSDFPGALSGPRDRRKPVGRLSCRLQSSTFIFNSISDRCPSRNFNFLPGRHGCPSPRAFIPSSAWMTAFRNSPP